MYDPRQLQVLTEVARTGSYTAAAEALGYTQPAVSYQMRTLERSVGAPLTTRQGRGIRLTAAGQALESVMLDPPPPRARRGPPQHAELSQ